MCNTLLIYWYYTYTLSPLYRDGVCHPLYREEDTLSPVYLSSSVYTIVVMYSYYTSNILTHSLLCTEMEYVILCIEKKTPSPCVENTISPLYRQGICNIVLIYEHYTDTLSPLYIDRALPSTILHTLQSRCREHNLSSVQGRSLSSYMSTI